MESFKQYIGSSEYWYIPVGVFVLFVLIAGLIGAWNGWKSASYFLGWNITGLIAGVMTSGIATDAIKDNVDLGDLPIDIAYVVDKFAVLIILFVELLVINFLAFIFYWFFRKKLKRTIKENKAYGKSNAAARWIGSGVGVITVLPMAVFLTETAALTSSENAFLTINSSLTRTLTFGKQDGYTDHDKQDLRDIIDIVSSKNAISDAVKGLEGSFNAPNTGTAPHITDEQKDVITDILSNKTLVNSLDLNKLDLGVSGLTDASGIPPLNLSQDQKDAINVNKDKIVEQILAANIAANATAAKEIYEALLK